MMRHTDGRTATRPLHRAWCAYCACSRSAGACYLQRRGPHWCLRGTHHPPRWWRHRSTSRTSSSYPLRSLPADRNTRLSTIRTFTHVQRPFPGTTQVSRYQMGKTNLDFTEARDSEWQWHQLGHTQVCISFHFQTDNHANTSPL